MLRVFIELTYEIMNYSKQSRNVNRSVTHSRDVVKTHVFYISFGALNTIKM